jgi:hypothetical protein
VRGGGGTEGLRPPEIPRESPLFLFARTSFVYPAERSRTASDFHSCFTAASFEFNNAFPEQQNANSLSSAELRIGDKSSSIISTGGRLLLPSFSLLPTRTENCSSNDVLRLFVNKEKTIENTKSRSGIRAFSTLTCQSISCSLRSPPFPSFCQAKSSVQILLALTNWTHAMPLKDPISDSIRKIDPCNELNCASFLSLRLFVGEISPRRNHLRPGKSNALVALFAHFNTDRRYVQSGFTFV